MPYRLPPPDQKARYVREKFDQIAGQYDLFNDLITQGQHRRWKRVMVERMAVPPGGLGLDLCCGTGDIAARAWRRLSGEGGLVAMDFSARMLEIARRRLSGASNAGAARRPWVLRGDAMRLPFRDGSLHFITVGYGLRNVTDLPGCLRELERVLRPGGVLASLDIGKVKNRFLRALSEFYLFRVVPRVGRVLQSGQEMFEYLPHSTTDYPDQGALRELLEETGFTGAEVIEFLCGASVIHLARKPG